MTLLSVSTRSAGAGRSTTTDADVANWLKTINETIAVNTIFFRVDDDLIWYPGGPEFDRVWVQAHVPMNDYRAAGPATAVDCDATPGQCTWVDLDAAFKFHDLPAPADLVDTESNVIFDYDAYYHAEDEAYPPPVDGIVRGQNGPVEVYEEQITQYLRTTGGLEGKTLEDVVFDGPIIPESHGILPASLPNRTDAPYVTYDSLADHDAAVAASEDWAKYVTFTLTFPDISELSSISIQIHPGSCSHERLSRGGARHRGRLRRYSRPMHLGGSGCGFQVSRPSGSCGSR